MSMGETQEFLKVCAKHLQILANMFGLVWSVPNFGFQEEEEEIPSGNS